MKTKLRRCVFSTAFVLTFCIPMLAMAQGAGTHPAAPSENVTVTGIKDMEAAVTKFVETMTVRTPVVDKLARWRQGVCPMILELRPAATKFVTNRFKDIAAIVGAPVNGKDSCPPNLEIVFTATPQALLDNIRMTHPILLGYHTDLAQAERLATVTRPIQSWYTTGTQDLDLNRTVDNGRCGGGGISVDMAKPRTGDPSIGNSSVPFETITLPCASAYAVTGNRLGNGLSSELDRVLIVADPTKLLDYEIGTLTDYISILALSQIQPPDRCQDMPSILNLLVPGCSRTANALTSFDVAYLRALYKMAATVTFGVQRDEMIYHMDQSLEARQ